MTTKTLILAVSLCAATLTACSDNDDDIKVTDVPEVCVNAFVAKYPEVKNARWERSGVYYTAEWREAANNREKEAWFKNTTQQSECWVMTETDYGKNLFMTPPELNDAFNKTEYSSATIDDIDLYEYPDATRDIFVIEVTPQQQQADVLLLFNANDYSFIKAVADQDIDITPDTVL